MPRRTLPVRASAVLAMLALASACREPRGAPEEPRPTAPAPYSVTVPPDTLPCTGAAPDSAAAVAAAFAALRDPALPLRLRSFTRHPEGMLVSLLPVSPAVIGGGGLVWVDPEGCLKVLKRYE